MQENKSANVQTQMLRHVCGDKHKAKMEKISGVDAHGMLENIAKELKLAGYTLSRCITSGTDHFTRLEVTTQIEIRAYRDYISKQKSGKQFKIAPKPYTRLEIMDKNPLQCLV